MRVIDLVRAYQKNKLKKDALPGGKGDNKTDKDFSKKEVAMGHKVEAEHTSNPKVVDEITLDHLSERNDYYSKLKEAGLADELEKGKNGDWKKEGYTFHVSPFGDVSNFDPQRHDLTVTAKDKLGNSIGYANMFHEGGRMYTAEVHIDPKHRRKGIYGGMIDHAENISGRYVYPSNENPHNSDPDSSMSNDAKSFWSNRFNKKSLQKGLKGDWQKEGYVISHDLDSNNKYITVTAHKDGKKVAELSAGHSSSKPGFLHPTNVKVDPAHQRKGIANAMYQLAEQKLGMPFAKATNQSQSAKKLWKQTNRPFGKSLEKSSNKVWLFEYGTLMHNQDPPKTELVWKKDSINADLGHSNGYKGAVNIGQSKNVLNGEVAEIDASELPKLDAREAVKKGEYRRIKIKTSGGKDAYVYEWTGKKLSKSEVLEKDAGQIAPKNLEPKFTRPDQEVKQISSNPSSPGNKIAVRKFKQAYNRPDADAVSGISIPSFDHKHPQAFAEAGKLDVVAHEGHHALVDKLVNKYSLPKIHNMYEKLVSNIHPKLLPVLNRILDSNPEYSRMTNHPNERYRLARKEEVVNILRDFVHGSGKDSRREAWGKAINNPDFLKAWGIKDRNEADSLVKQSWKKVRDHANIIKPEDL